MRSEKEVSSIKNMEVLLIIESCFYLHVHLDIIVKVTGYQKMYICWTFTLRPFKMQMSLFSWDLEKFSIESLAY